MNRDIIASAVEYALDKVYRTHGIALMRDHEEKPRTYVDMEEGAWLMVPYIAAHLSVDHTYEKLDLDK